MLIGRRGALAIISAGITCWGSKLNRTRWPSWLMTLAPSIETSSAPFIRSIVSQRSPVTRDLSASRDPSERMVPSPITMTLLQSASISSMSWVVRITVVPLS